MSVPSRMSMRHIPGAFQPRVRVAYAQAWEAIIDTHASQAAEFVQEFASRVPPLDALELYFRVVAVPEPMVETVRNRALTQLALDCLPNTAMMPALSGWQLLRPDLWLAVFRFRKEFTETTIALARLVGARAAEAVTATHTSHALDFVRLLEGVLPSEKSLEHYVFVHSLSHTMANTVIQRVQAQLAGKRLAEAYRTPGSRPNPFHEPAAVRDVG